MGLCHQFPIWTINQAQLTIMNTFCFRASTALTSDYLCRFETVGVSSHSVVMDLFHKWQVIVRLWNRNNVHVIDDRVINVDDASGFVLQTCYIVGASDKLLFSVEKFCFSKIFVGGTKLFLFASDSVSLSMTSSSEVKLDGSSGFWLKFKWLGIRGSFLG